MKLKQVLPKPNNTSVIIYYSFRGKEMRYPTGISISADVKNGKYVDWDYKLNMLKPSVKDFESKKKTILDLVKRADKILLDNYNNEIETDADELVELLSGEQQVKKDYANAQLLDHYNAFLQIKREKFEATQTIISLKDFTSTKNLLEAYEVYTGKKYKVHVLADKSWLQGLLNFMRKDLPKKIGDYQLKTMGKMKPKTIKKRLDIIIQFADHLKDLKLITLDTIDNLKKFRRKEVTIIQSQKETLTIEEIHKLYKFKFKEIRLENIKDVFVFLCFTGIRFQDLIEFDYKFVKPSVDKNGLIYQKKASKTGIDYNIPLSEIVLAILKKYNNVLPIISNTQSNLYIKEALQKTGMFDQTTEIVDKLTGEYIQRYQAITMHKGRDTFITNLVDTTPLNELMKYTGHKKLSTLQGYIDNKRPVKMQFINIFNLK